jgi:CRP/FNR family transcriptional regulator, polysaccharide utilization system transcription regulator
VGYEKKNIVIPDCDKCTNTDQFFCSLSVDEKKKLSERKSQNFFKKGQAIFYEGNSAVGLYCVHSGKVKLSKLGREGKEQIVRFAKSGDIVGYRALFCNEPYQATATAMDDVYVCMISRERFLQIVEENPKFSLKLIQLLSGDLRMAEKHLLDVAQKTVRERVCESLLVLETIFGYEEDKKTLNVSLSRSEMADIAATTPESAIRTLLKLKEEKIIAFSGKKIIISNRKAVITEAGVYD